jgi:hypothetical protein
VGWDAVNKAWEEVLRKVTSKIDNYLIRAGVPQIIGNLAWEIDTEAGPVTFADGKSINFTAFATNIYQNIDGHWLMVSHQAGNQTETSPSQNSLWTLSQYPRRLSWPA